MPKLGPVAPIPPPVDPFKQQGTPGLGVVTTNEVTAAPEKTPKLGVVYQRPSQVVDVTPVVPETIGVVNPVVAPPPPTPPWLRPSPLGRVLDDTPVYPPVAAPPKPALGTIVDRAITPPAPIDDSMDPPVPIASQPVVVSPLEPKDE